jgi:hypothetical protein
MKKLFLMAAAAATMMVSCDMGPDNNSENGGEAMMGLSFTIPNPAQGSVTRAGEDGTPAESAVSSIRVWVFKDNGVAEVTQAYAFPADASKFTITNNGQQNATYVLNSANYLTVAAGTKTVYIAANLPATPASDTWETITKANLEAEAVELSAASATSKFIMIASKSQAVSPKLAAQTPDQNAEDNEVSISLKRVAAKVAVTTDSNNAANPFTQAFDEGGVTISYKFDKWGVVNYARNMYLVDKGQNVDSPDYYETLDATTLGNAFGAKAAYATTAPVAYVGSNYPSTIGDATYAMMRSRVTINKRAVPGPESTVTWEGTPITNADFWVVKDSDGKVYFVADADEDIAKANAETIAARVGGTAVKYAGGYVYHTYILNNEEDGDAAKNGAIASNEFLHVNVTGVKDNVFGGTPGKAPTGETPEDPITDPGEPITTEPAYLIVDVSVAKWDLTTVDTEL